MSYLHVVRTKASFDGMDILLVRHVDGEHRRFEDGHFEPVLILTKPFNSVASISVPSSEALKLLNVHIIEFTQASGTVKITKYILS